MAKKIQKYTLVGCDGNAFSVMGYVCRAFEESGRLLNRSHVVTDANKKNFMDLAMAGNYDDLLCISMSTLEDINDSLEKAGFISEDSDEAEEMIARLTAMGYNVSR